MAEDFTQNPSNPTTQEQAIAAQRAQAEAQADVQREALKHAIAFSQPRNDNQAPSASFQAINAQYEASRNRVVTGGGVSYQGAVTPTAAQNPYNPDSAAGIAWEVARTGGGTDYPMNIKATAEVLSVGGDPGFIRYATNIYAERPSFAQETITTKQGQTITNPAWEGVPIRQNLTLAEMQAGGGITEQNYQKFYQYDSESHMLNRLQDANVQYGVDVGVHTAPGDWGGPVLQDNTYGGLQGHLVGSRVLATVAERTPIQQGTFVMVPEGKNTWRQIENAKVAIDQKSGEIAIYQQRTPGSSVYSLIGGGGRNAAQSELFAMYKGENHVNFADLAEKVALEKSAAPGADIPWGIKGTSPSIVYMDEKGLTGGYPAVAKMFEITNDRLVGGRTVAATTQITSVPQTTQEQYNEPWSILPQEDRIYLAPPSELFTYGKGSMADIFAFAGSSLYSIAYGQVRGAETVRAQERFESQPIFSERLLAQKEYVSASTELESKLSDYKQYVSLDTGSGKYIISRSTPENIVTDIKSSFARTESAYKNLDALTKQTEILQKESPLEQLKSETTSAFRSQKPFEIFGMQPTVAWKYGVETLASPLIGSASGGTTGIITQFTSQKATNVGESIAYGILDVPGMGIQMIADAPLGVEMTTRDIFSRGTLGISTVGGYGQASFGKYVVEDPVRATTMLAAGLVTSRGIESTKQYAMERTGLSRLSTYEYHGQEVVANAPATRTIEDIIAGKDVVDVTHSAPSPIIRGLVQISREEVGDIGHGTGKPGIFGAPISKSETGKTLLEPTSEFFLNKPLLIPAIMKTAEAVHGYGTAILHRSGDYTAAREAFDTAARGYINFAKRSVPIIGGSRVYIFRNVETLAPELRTTHTQLINEMRSQWKTKGYLDVELYNRYVELAYEKSAAGGGKPIAVVAPKKAAGYHLGDRGAMGAPFESEVYIVSATRSATGDIVPVHRIEMTGKQFLGYSYGRSGAKVVEAQLAHQTTTIPKRTVATRMKENINYNKDTFKSQYLPYDTLLKMNVGGSTIQRGWYEAMLQDAIHKANEMYGTKEWAPVGYYGKHGKAHSETVVQNIQDIYNRSPETVERIGGSGGRTVADAYAKAMGLAHDIAKVGEAESQPYTHAFVTAEAIRSGSLKSKLEPKVYSDIFGSLSKEHTERIADAISQHTKIQPIRAPTLAEVVNWKQKTGREGESGHISDTLSGMKTIADPFKGVVSKVLWKPREEGRVLSAADRVDIGRVGATVQSSKIFRTPEEQREVNIKTIEKGVVAASVGISIHAGIPPVVGAVLFKDIYSRSAKGADVTREYQRSSITEQFAKAKEYREDQAYKQRGKEYSGSTLYDQFSKYQQYQKPYEKAYEKGYESKYQKEYKKDYSSEYVKDYIKNYGRDYSKDYTKDYSKDYVKDYTKPYEKPYEKRYAGYEGYKEKPYVPYQPDYKPYHKEYTPPTYDYTPYEYKRPPPDEPYVGLPGFMNIGGGGSGGILNERTRKREYVNPVVDIEYLTSLAGSRSGGILSSFKRKR